MKKLLQVSSILAVCVSFSQAATSITIANLGERSLLVTDRTGQVYSGGSWAVGVFSDGVDFAGTPQSIYSAWVQAGNTAAFNPTFPGVFGAAGAETVSVDLPTTVTGSFVGNDMFIMIGDAATLETSTEFIVADTGIQFQPEVEGVGGTSSALFADATILRGDSTIVSGAAGPTDPQNGEPGITFIPEPSVALLGAFGILGLLRRRR